MAGNQPESVLAFDCGSAYTRAFLIDKVDGEFRFVARGEALSTPGKLAEALVEAIRDVEVNTRRRLLHGATLIMPEGLDGSGVDAAALAWSAGPPLRVVGAGISPAQSISDVSATVAGAVADLVASFCLQDIRRKDQKEAKAAAVRESKPDAILLVTGSSGRGNPLVAEVGEFIARAKLAGKNGNRLPLVVAGSPVSCEDVSKALGAVLDVRRVGPLRAADFRSVEVASSCLNDLYVHLTAAGRHDLDSVAGDRWSAMVAAPKAVGTVAQFIAKQTRTDVLLADLGASLTTVAATVDGQIAMAVSTNCGLGRGIYGVASEIGAETIARWLPFTCGAEQVLRVGLNKGLHPQSVAQLPEELLIEEAFAREALRQAAGRINPEPDLIVASGGFLPRLPRRGRLALLLLDALQPSRVTALACDALGLIPSLGAVASAFPQVAGEVLMRDALVRLGTVVPLLGSGKDGQAAAHTVASYADGGESQLDVAWGEVRVIPLPDTKTARLLIQPSPEGCIGDSRKGRSVELEVAGGALGIIVDARGRPLNLPSDSGLRIAKLSEWYNAFDN